MTEIATDRVVVAAELEAIRAIMADPAALARILPGAESLQPDGAGRWRGVLATRIGFLTLRAEAVATLHDLEPPRRLRLDVEGKPRGLAGSFRATIPFELEPSGPGRTTITYRVDVLLTGRLASFGTPLLRDTMRRQVAALVANLEREAGSA
jgi:carbon monoxide dehydrogenase subunit G